MKLEAVVVLAGRHISNSNDVNWPDCPYPFQHLMHLEWRRLLNRSSNY